MRLVRRTAAGGYAIPSGVSVQGRIHPPPSKSLTQRALNLALLARRPTTIRRPLLAEDTELYLAALQQLGFRCQSHPLRIDLEPGAPTDSRAIWCGHNGTMLRFLTAALTTIPGAWSLDGSPRLQQRPIGPLVEALRTLGARLSFRDREGYAPLTIEGASLTGGEVSLDASLSSQFVSALAMAAARAEGQVVIRLTDLVSKPYLSLTLEVMAAFGAAVETSDDGCMLRVTPTSLGQPEYEVEADFSSAAYPAAAALLTGGRVTLEGLSQSSSQGDRGFLEVMAGMGGEVSWSSTGVELRSDGRLRGVDIDLANMPDQVPTLAALAPFAVGRTRIRNVRHLRLKESDRLAAMMTELNRLGAEVEMRDDGLVIEGSWSDRSRIPTGEVRVDTHGDHRVAMSLAVCGLVRPGVIVDHPDVVVKSFPTFWEDFDSLLFA